MADRYMVLKFPDCCPEKDVAHTLNIWSKEYSYSVINTWHQQESRRSGERCCINGAG